MEALNSCLWKEPIYVIFQREGTNLWSYQRQTGTCSVIQQQYMNNDGLKNVGVASLE